MPFPVVAFLGLCKVCAVVGGTIFCAHKASKAYEKGQKTKQEKYALKGKSLDEARKDNERITKENEEIEKKLKESEERIKSFEKKIEDAKKEIENPNTSPQRKDELRSILTFLQTELDDERKKFKSFWDKKNKNDKERENNNKIIKGVGLNPDDKHWIWDLFTLENALILGGCYVLYKLAKDDK